MSGLAVKLDENLGESHARLLREAGYECDRVTDQGLSGASDEGIWARVVAEGRFFITLDLDFSDLRQYAPGTHPGVLLLRPMDGARDAVAAVLRNVLARNAPRLGRLPSRCQPGPDTRSPAERLTASADRHNQSPRRSYVG